MKIIRIILNLLRVLFVVSIVFSLAGFLSKYGLYFDWAAHFRMQYFVIQLVFIFLFIILKHWKELFIAVLITGINLTQILPLYIPPSYPNFQERKNINKISILSINLCVDNKKHSKTIEYIKSINPDILLLTEINESWYKTLSSVLNQFAYNKYVVRNDCFGVGMFSKLPSNDINIKYCADVHIPTIVANFDIDMKPLTLIVIHTLPPSNKNQYCLRNKHLECIGSMRSHFAGNLVLMGDLNTTSWSFSFKNLLRRMNLYDSRRGFGLQNSWPTVFSFFKIAIDHCLVSKDIIVFERKIGPNIGSDHYPIYVQLGLVK